MRYINSRFTYLLTYLLTGEHQTAAVYNSKWHTDQH